MNKQLILEQCNATSRNTLMETLQITYTDVGEDFIVASMPVNERVHQPDGVLHGGATAALAESVGSVASHLFIDRNQYFIRGLEITANHVKSVKTGHVHARATIIHKGRTTQLWDIKVTDDDGNLISVCKLNTIALPKNS